MQRRTRLAMACVLGALATTGLTGCVLPTLTLSNTQAKGWSLADPTAIDSGGQYTYGTNYFVFRVPVVAPNGAISDALTSNPGWAAGNYTAAPDVRTFPDGTTRMYFTATKAGHAANTNNCIGVATARPGSLTQFDPGGAILCAEGQEFWDPDVEFLADGTPVLLFTTMNGSAREIRSIRLSADGTGTQGASTMHTLLSNSSTTIENPTAIYDGVAGQWVMLFSQGDWTTSNYATVMAYCPGTNLDAACNVQGQRGSFPWNPKAFGLYGTGGMDLFSGAGGLNAVYHYWATDNPFTRGDRKTAQSNVTLTDPQG